MRHQRACGKQGWTSPPSPGVPSGGLLSSPRNGRNVMEQCWKCLKTHKVDKSGTLNLWVCTRLAIRRLMCEWPTSARDVSKHICSASVKSFRWASVDARSFFVTKSKVKGPMQHRGSSKKKTGLPLVFPEGGRVETGAFGAVQPTSSLSPRLHSISWRRL